MKSVHKETDIDSGKFRTHVLEAGRSGAPRLFMLHDGGLGGDLQTSWAQLIPYLQDDFYIFAIDLYGFGRSCNIFEFGRRPYESHIEQVADVARRLDIGGAVFIGSSYGGSLVLRAASRTPPPWPMLGGISIGGTGGVFRHAAGKQMLVEIEPTRESLARFVSMLARDEWPGFEECVDHRLRNALRPGHWEALAAPRLRRAGADKVEEVDDYPAALSVCAVPLLLIEGTEDELLEDEWASRIASHAPLGRSIKINGRHSPNLDSPAQLARVIREFVGVLPR